MSETKRTNLYDVHKDLGARFVEFGGWEMPVQYSGVLEEHEGVRTRAGLFDVSHMGEIEVKGRDAKEFVNYLVTNDITKMENNQVLYAFMCYGDGGIVDDLLIYKYNNNHFLLVVNASNVDKDYDWIIQNKRGEVQIKNLSGEISEVALQGPFAQEILSGLTDQDLDEIPFFYFKDNVEILCKKCLVSRTGYTGEDGFEIYMANDDAKHIWQGIMEAGKNKGILAAGLGARDTLRFEAVLPLYGHEIDRDINPLEAGLDFFVKLNKDQFIGKEALIDAKNQGLKRKLVGFEMIERGIPRQGYPITKEGAQIGHVTTGFYSPTLKKNIGLALVKVQHSQLDTRIKVVIRNKEVEATIIKTPFYKKRYKK